MAITQTEAAGLLERARTEPLNLHFHLSTTGDDCLVELAAVSAADNTFSVSESWYNLDCVGPSHGETMQRELSGPEVIARLIELVETPYEITTPRAQPPQSM